MSMKSILLALGTTICLFPVAASAVELSGASLDLGYSAFSDDNDISRFAAKGAVEIGFSSSFATQIDLSFYSYGSTSDNGSTVTAHAIYRASDVSAFGVFYGQDDLAGTADYYGLEAGYDLGGFDAEIYVAAFDDTGSEGTLFGLSARTGLGQGFGLGLSLDGASYNLGLDLTRLAVQADYTLSPMTTLYAEIGNLDANAFGLSGSETFFGIGARINLGTTRGATFSNRGLLAVLPGL